jgi:hypothetical protein
VRPGPVACVCGVAVLSVALLLARRQIDGRPAHATLRGWLRLRLGPARVAAFRRAPGTTWVRFGSVTIAWPSEAGERPSTTGERTTAP